MNASKKKQSRAPKAAKRSKREQYLEQIRKQAVLDHINAQVVKDNRNCGRDAARDVLRKELAAWVMSMRQQVHRLYDQILSMRTACLEDGNLLQDLIEGEAMLKLGEAGRCLESTATSLELVTIDCPQPDVFAIAEGYQKNWHV